MSNKLVELSRTKTITGSSLVFEDYNQHPKLCRHGLWVGLLESFTETVTLEYEHTEDPFYVGWMVNGITVVDPGYSTGTPPWGSPAPGAPSVTYNCPVGGFFHEISFTSTSGAGEECLSVQVLYRGPADEGSPAHYGPITSVCLSGSAIEWPADKLAAEAACLSALFDRLRRYVQVAHVNPGDPVEWLSHFQGEEAVQIKEQLETLESLDDKKQNALASAIRANLSGLLRSRISTRAAEK